MTIDFNRAKETINQNHQEQAEKEDLIQSFQNTDTEAALLGALMNISGKTEICGIEYSLQKAHCEEQMNQRSNNYERFSAIITN